MSLKTQKIKSAEKIKLLIFCFAALVIFSAVLSYAFWSTPSKVQTEKAAADKTSANQNAPKNLSLPPAVEAKPLTNAASANNSNQNANLNQNINQSLNVNQVEPAVATQATINFQLASAALNTDLKLDCLADGICAQETYTQEMAETAAVTNATPVEGYAAGDITIHNLSGEALSLAIQSRLLSTEGVLFRTQERKTVPAHGSAKVYSRTDTKGAAGDIGPSRFTLVALSGVSRSVYYGTTDEPMTGGVINKGVVTEEAVKNAKDKLLNQFQEDWQKKLGEIQPTTTIVQKDSGPIISKDKIAPSLGTETTEFTVSLTINQGYIVYKETQWQSYLKTKFPGQSVTCSGQPTFNLEGGKAILATACTSQTQTSLDQEKIKADLAGKTIAQAQTYLQALGVENIQIDLSSTTATVLPDKAEDIEILSK